LALKILRKFFFNNFFPQRLLGKKNNKYQQKINHILIKQ
jgi:hypothetical protein